MTDFAAELRCAEALAREAGKRMLRGREAGFAIETKGVNDLVTDVDRAVERFVVGQLRSLFPDDGILGEEYGEDAEDKAGAERHWLVDPIDGTTNFAHGIPLSCVSIALQSGGQSVVGVVYEPYRDELFSARHGHGAWLDGRQLSVSDCPELADALLVTGFPVARSPELERSLAEFAQLTRAARGVRRLGSAALDLAYVAAGRIDAFWEYGLAPWDTGAGCLLVAEAGGRVTDIDGQAFAVDSPSILATNGHLHTAIVDTVDAVRQEVSP